MPERPSLGFFEASLVAFVAVVVVGMPLRLMGVGGSGLTWLTWLCLGLGAFLFFALWEGPTSRRYPVDESLVCQRCHGTGRGTSISQVGGGVCFKCSGSGQRNDFP